MNSTIGAFDTDIDRSRTKQVIFGKISCGQNSQTLAILALIASCDNNLNIYSRCQNIFTDLRIDR